MSSVLNPKSTLVFPNRDNQKMFWELAMTDHSVYNIAGQDFYVMGVTVDIGYGSMSTHPYEHLRVDLAAKL